MAADLETLYLQYSVDGGGSWHNVHSSITYKAGGCRNIGASGHLRYDHMLQAVISGSVVPENGTIEFRVTGGYNTQVKGVHATVLNS